MDTAIQIITVLLPLLYLGVTSAYGLLFFANHPTARRAAPPLLAVTLALHLAYLVILGLPLASIPRRLGVAAALSGGLRPGGGLCLRRMAGSRARRLAS